MNILIVDDDPGIRDMLTQLLEDEGHDVVSTTNGLEALSLLKEHEERPCLILLDLMMPVMTGWEFRQEQQQDPELAPIPVVVVSAAGDLQQKASAIQASGYLQKPINFDTLLDTVERYCTGEDHT